MPKKILIEDVRSTRHGLLILPLIDSILATYKDVRISCWVNPDVAEILKDDKRIDSFLIWFSVKNKPIKYYRRQTKELKKHHFDVVLSLSNNLPNIVVSYFAKIPNRIGLKGRFLNNLLLTKSTHYNLGLLHQSEKNAQLLSLIGINKAVLTTEIFTNTNDDFVVNHYLKKVKSENKKVILIHLTKDIIKKYKEESIKQLIKKIVSNNEFSVILSGDKLLGDFINYGGPKILNLVDKLSRSQQMSLMKGVAVSILFCDGMAQGAEFLRVPFVYISSKKNYQLYENGFLAHNCKQIDEARLQRLMKNCAQIDCLINWVIQSLDKLIGNP